MVLPLLSPFDLREFPGAPFKPTLVEVAAQSVRADAGWHIAPVITETVTLRHVGGCELVLPTRRLVSVSAVNADTTGWDSFTSGILYRAGGWPAGLVSVTMTHGFDSCPADLLPLVASRASARDMSVSSQTTGPFAVTYRATDSPFPSRYSIATFVA